MSPPRSDGDNSKSWAQQQVDKGLGSGAVPAPHAALSDWEIVQKLTVGAEYKLLGVSVIASTEGEWVDVNSPVNGGGNVAYINIRTGHFSDKKNGIDQIDLFEFAVRAGYFADHDSARRHYRRKVSGENVGQLIRQRGPIWHPAPATAEAVPMPTAETTMTPTTVAETAVAIVADPIPSQVAPQLTSEQQRDAYDAGHSSRILGVPRERNPFAETEELHQHWADGWTDADATSEPFMDAALEPAVAMESAIDEVRPSTPAEIHSDAETGHMARIRVQRERVKAARIVVERARLEFESEVAELERIIDDAPAPPPPPPEFPLVLLSKPLGQVTVEELGLTPGQCKALVADGVVSATGLQARIDAGSLAKVPRIGKAKADDIREKLSAFIAARQAFDRQQESQSA